MNQAEKTNSNIISKSKKKKIKRLESQTIMAEVKNLQIGCNSLNSIVRLRLDLVNMY